MKINTLPDPVVSFYRLLMWNSPAGRLVSARVTGHADTEANCPR